MQLVTVMSNKTNKGLQALNFGALYMKRGKETFILSVEQQRRPKEY
jgi:hypothetical protein